MKHHISRKEDNLARYTEILGNFLPKVTIFLKFPEFLVEWFAFQKFNFFWKKSVSCIPVLNFRNF